MSEATPNLNHHSMTRTQVVDAYFMEHRARLLDVAAFLDRIDRAGPGVDDFRMNAYRNAIALLLDGKPWNTSATQAQRQFPPRTSRAQQAPMIRLERRTNHVHRSTRSHGESQH